MRSSHLEHTSRLMVVSVRSFKKHIRSPDLSAVYLYRCLLCTNTNAVTDRVCWLPFRILGSPCRRLDLCQMATMLALRCMVSPHTVTPSGALRYTHARTHARSALSNVTSFLEGEIPSAVCLLTCRQLFDLPVHLNDITKVFCDVTPRRLVCW